MTDMLMRACALALQRYPEVNASWVDGHFERKRRVSIGLAVPPEKGLGLLVPVVHDVDKKDLVALSIEARQVIERARAGRPSPGDLEGGTFSISAGASGIDIDTSAARVGGAKTDIKITWSTATLPGGLTFQGGAGADSFSADPTSWSTTCGEKKRARLARCRSVSLSRSMADGFFKASKVVMPIAAE